MANYIKDIRKKVGHDPIFAPGAGAIIYKQGKILLQKRQDDGKWALHGGSMELGETQLQTLERELKEEINIRPVNPELMGIYTGKDFYYEYPNEDKIYDVLCIFLVQEYEGELQKDNEEVIELKWFDLENLPKEIHSSDGRIIKDLKSFLQNKKVIVH